MKRSHAPSKNAQEMKDGSIRVVQAPLMPFLTVPKPRTQFRAPRVEDTSKLALGIGKGVIRRAVGSLGRRKRRPGGGLVLSAMKRVASVSVTSEPDEDVPSIETPASPKSELASGTGSEASEAIDPDYDPIVLWVPESAGGIRWWDELREVALAEGKPAPRPPKGSVVVDSRIGKFLRPHQREGVRFVWDCITGERVVSTGPGVLGLKTAGNVIKSAAALAAAVPTQTSVSERSSSASSSASASASIDPAQPQSAELVSRVSPAASEVTASTESKPRESAADIEGDTDQQQPQVAAAAAVAAGGDEVGRGDVNDDMLAHKADAGDDEDDATVLSDSDSSVSDFDETPKRGKKPGKRAMPVAVPRVDVGPLEGSILADDMGLGKTLQSVTLLWTALNQGPHGKPLAQRVIVVTPTSLVSNWSKELEKWLHGACDHVALSEASRAKVEDGIDRFLAPTGPRVLILSYETFRIHAARLTGPGKEAACELLICDEAHRLKNDETLTTKALAGLQTRRRILLSGTPIQNNLDEFFAMANFTNPGVLGTAKQFHKHFETPILEAREPGAHDSLLKRASAAAEALSAVVNQFVLRRTNALLSEHLPPKLVQVVVCPLTPLQRHMYETVLASDHVQRIVNSGVTDTGELLELDAEDDQPDALPTQVTASTGAPADDDDDDDDRRWGGGRRAAATSRPAPANKSKGSKGALPVISMLRKICNHPALAMQQTGAAVASSSKGRRGSSSSAGGGGVASVTASLQQEMLNVCDMPAEMLAAAQGHGTSLRRGGGLDPSLGSKLGLLANMLELMRSQGRERIVVVSIFTQTLDLVSQLCRERHFPYIRLDGSISAGKRMKLVDRFNDPARDEFVFLLSSRAGGCGLNLVGASRLVLLDCDWNPAVDKQAAARVWRDGQKRRVFVYRMLAAGTLEEKIFQRQLSKEGLHTIVVEEKAEATALSSEALKSLFKYDGTVESDTHRALRCKRCFKHGDVAPGASQDWIQDNGLEEADCSDDDDDDSSEENEHDEADLLEEAASSSSSSSSALADTDAHCGRFKGIASDRRQLGHPEEADLTRWSHHADLSTVEKADPILVNAAAMAPAGSPYVSFVFGLQVQGCKVQEVDDTPITSKGSPNRRSRAGGLHSSSSSTLKALVSRNPAARRRTALGGRRPGLSKLHANVSALPTAALPVTAPCLPVVTPALPAAKAPVVTESAIFNQDLGQAPSMTVVSAQATIPQAQLPSLAVLSGSAAATPTREPLTAFPVNRDASSSSSAHASTPLATVADRSSSSQPRIKGSPRPTSVGGLGGILSLSRRKKS